MLFAAIPAVASTLASLASSAASALSGSRTPIAEHKGKHHQGGGQPVQSINQSPPVPPSTGALNKIA